MKLIDKYLLKTLMVPLTYCLLAFAMIYVIYDLFDNLEDFIKGQTPLLDVVKFYVFLMPSVINIIAPVSLLLSVLYSLSSLTRSNELTAMRASGLSLYRLVTPMIMVGLTATILVALIHETLGPWSAYWTRQFILMQRSANSVPVHLAFNLAFKNEVDRRIWMIGTFDTKTFLMEDVNVLQQREDGSDAAKIRAKSGHWLDDRWWFEEISTQTYTPEGNPTGAAKIELRSEMNEFRETPKDFINEIKDPEYLSSREILTFLRTHRHISRDTKARIKVNLHNRLAMPWTCLIVTLLGIPFGAKTGRKGAFLGVVLALSSFFGFYFLVNLGLAFGKKQILAPWVAGWMPNIVFLIIGLILVYRMR